MAIHRARRWKQWLGVGLLTTSLGAWGCSEEVCTPSGEGEANGVQNGTCAPEGERFTDHFSCEGVEGPCAGGGERGAKAQVAADPATQSDPDLAWSANQIRACSCSCCHNNQGVAAHIYSWDFAPAWTDSLSTERLERVVGEYNSDEDIAAADNNGFSRLGTGIPSTDPTRLSAFLARELERRQ
jgi:hypothetical protein